MTPIIPVPPVNIPNVPFYSQFYDIDSIKWKKVGCGVASLAMVINYYKPETVTVNKLLIQGITDGAYDQKAGWIYSGLISLAKQYGLSGKAYDLQKLSNASAFKQFKNNLKNGPVIVSVHYKFDPKSTIPHLVVVDGIDNNVIYYNDPATKTGQSQISVENFLKGWKKRFIVIEPKILLSINKNKL
jgi:predicted double-glycine peptidase